MATLILASTSEWRLQLLRDAGVDASAVDPAVDERKIIGETPTETAELRAEAKTRSVVNTHPDSWVLGADQVIHLDGEAIGKPENHDVWRKRLQAMRGRTHDLTTAIALWDGRSMEVCAVTSKVRFRADVSDRELEDYIGTGEAKGCAGGYMVERRGAWLVESVEGDWLNVVGLPVLTVIGLLRSRGMTVPV
jgi:septum formation protein